MDNNGNSFDENQSYDVNNTLAKNDRVSGEQSRTSDDITNDQRTPFDSENMGEPTSIGNEDFEEDGGADLGFGETDETEDKDRDSPLRREPGGSTSDGTNEGDYPGGKGNAGGNIGNLRGIYDTNSSNAGGSGTMRK
jgi:hypothetical protein